MIEYIIPKFNGDKWVYNIRTADSLGAAKDYVSHNAIASHGSRGDSAI